MICYKKKGEAISAVDANQLIKFKLSCINSYFFNKPSVFIQAIKSSVQLSLSKPCFFMPKPWLPFEKMCSSAECFASIHVLYSDKLCDCKLNVSSVAAAMNMGGASAGTLFCISGGK